jgi:hypothetical protein
VAWKYQSMYIFYLFFNYRKHVKMKKNFNIYYMRDHLKVVHMKWIAKSYCYKAPISDLWWSLKFLLVWYHWQRLYVISSNFFSMNLNFITLLLMLTKRRSINPNLWHTCESPSATCLYMLYEIHDGKAVLSCCLHLHTPQGIYSICQIKPILVKRTNYFLHIFGITVSLLKSRWVAVILTYSLW